jgi:hypothetical protein
MTHVFQLRMASGRGRTATITRQSSTGAVSTAPHCRGSPWRRNRYHAVAPQFLTTAQAAPSIRTMFGPVERLVFKILGIRQFMQLLLATR